MTCCPLPSADARALLVTSSYSEGLGVDGVYIDQLAAAGPVLDFSPGRTHGAGGGAWWSSGIAGMLKAVRTKTPDAPVFVEGNAEDKIGVSV